MTLYEFISEMDRRRFLAKKTNRNPDYLWQVATGRRSASPRLAIAIEEVTTGFGVGTVFKHELRPDIWGKELGRKKKAA